MLSGLADFTEGEAILIDGRRYVFERLIEPEEVRHDAAANILFKDARTFRPREFTPEEFARAYGLGQIKYERVHATPGDSAGDGESAAAAAARQRRLFWTSLYDRFPVSKATVSLRHFIEEHAAQQDVPRPLPSSRTLCRWLSERGEAHDRRPLHMGNRRKPPSDLSALSPIVQAAFDQASARYWSNHKVRFADLYIAVRAAVISENSSRRMDGLASISMPGRTTLWRRLQLQRTYENVLSRDGKIEADRRFKPVSTSETAKRILDRAVLDHKLMDVHVCDSSRRFPLGRPWLAVLLDEKSRMVLGYSLSFESPSVLSAMACIRASLRGMPDLDAKFPRIEGRWEAFGVARTIVADNAWENTGSSFPDACANNGISIEWAPVRQPQHKGKLERWFRTLDTQLAHKLPGAVTAAASDLRRRGINPQSDVAITLHELEEFVCQWIVDVYSHDIHSKLGRSPISVWRDGANRHHIELAHDLSEAEHAMGRLVRDRSLTREGVRYKNLRYCSADVEALLADLLPMQAASRTPGSAEVQIKVHPEDLSRIFVYNPKRNIHVPLPCTDQAYARNLSERVHQMLQEDRDSSHEEDDDQRVLRKAKLHRDIANSFPKQKTSERRRSARLLPTDRSGDERAIMVAPHLSRVDGDRPEKSRVRARSRKRQPQPKPELVAAPVASALVVVDPFAAFDREAELHRSVERLGK